MLPTEARLPEVPGLLAGGAYVIVHAPRLSGKTTWIRGVARILRDEPGALAVVEVSCAGLHRHAGVAAQRALLERIAKAAGEQLPPGLGVAPWPESYDVRFVAPILSAWARVCPRRLVLLFDDVDALPDAALRDTMAQLHSMEPAKTRGAPWSVLLCGTAELVAASFDTHLVDVATELVLPDFTLYEVGALVAQHEEDTGQPFTIEAVSRLVEVSGGHPWVVNAIAREVVEKLSPLRHTPISHKHIDEAHRRLGGAWV